MKKNNQLLNYGIALLSLVSLTTTTKAQTYCSGTPANCELVCNGSFETIALGLPTGWGSDVTGYYPVNSATGWITTNGTPDLFHVSAAAQVKVPCNFGGYQYAHTGSAYAGIFTDGGLSSNVSHGYFEGIKTVFSDYMTQGKTYEINLWVSKADFTTVKNKNLIIDIAGVYTYTVPSSKLNDAVNWVNINFTYCSLGIENELTIYANDFSAYTSVASNTVTGCSASTTYDYGAPYLYIDDVSVREAKFAVTSTSVACINSPTNFSINSLCGVNLPNYTYNWNFGDGTSTVNTGTVTTASHIYTAGGNYTGTVTVNSGGCAVKYTFTASAPTLGVNINAPVNTICNAINTFTALPTWPGTYTYSWTVKDASTNAVITLPITNSTTATPSINFTSVNQNVNVCVTITNPYGCSISNCVYLPSCCPTPTNVVKYTNTTFASNLSITSPSVAFGGTITINTGVTLSITNSNVKLDPNTKFILNGTATLTLSNVYMHSCNAMWDGIYANGTAKVQMNMSRIEDAIQAINDPAGAASVILTNNYFNKNRTGILFSAAKTNTSVVTITNNLFTSATIPVPASAPWFTVTPNLTNAPTLGAYASTNMLLPYNTVKSLVGIQANNASHTGKTADNMITIGGATTQENVFDKIEFGIINYQSSVQSQNNVFQNIKYTANSSNLNSAGIYAVVLFNTGAYYMGVGGATTLRNTFINNDYGLNNIGQFKILNTYNTYSLQTTAVYVTYNNNGSVVNIRNNNFYQNLVGINCFNNTAINVSIKDNNLFNNTTAVGTYSNNFAIRCTEAAIATSTASYPIYTIDNNNIQNYYNGIWNAQTLNALVFDNEVHMRQDNATDHWQRGIHVENSNNSQIKNNIVDMPGLNQYGYWQVGIDVGSNQIPKVQCNSTNNVCMGLTFSGNNVTATGDGVIGNYMNNNGYGIWLTNYAEIGTQFKTNASTNYSADNAWNVTCSGCWNIFSQNSSNTSNSTMFSRNSASGIYHLPNAKTGFDASIGCNIMFGTNNSTGFTNICNNNASTPSNLKLGANAMAKLMQNADDIIAKYSPSFNAGMQPDALLAQQKIREQHLLQTINLQGVDVSNEPSLTTFVNSHKQKNTAKLLAIDALLHQAETDSNKIAIAKQANSQLQADDYMEQTQQDFNDLYLGYLQQNKKANTTNVTKLESIANLCPTYYGGVVYQARALLYDLVKKQYSNECETIAPPKSNKKLAQTVGENADLFVYPNPASNELHIDMKGYDYITIKLYNLMGALVLNKTIENNQPLIVSDLSDGIYLYKLYYNGTELKTDKLTIIK